MLSRAEEGCSGSTGLTQEIDIMDIGSSTPKRKKSKSPLKGVLKIRFVLHLVIYTPTKRAYIAPITIPSFSKCRSLSDDEAPANEPNNAQVLFSTPVSSLKAPRSTMLKLKTTRFQLPASTEKMCHKSQSSISTSVRYINVSGCCAQIKDSLPVSKMPKHETFHHNVCVGLSNVANKFGSSHRSKSHYAKNEGNPIPYTTISSPESSCIK